MKKISILFLLFIVLTLSACNKPSTSAQSSNDVKATPKTTNTSAKNDVYPMSSIEEIAEKLEIYYFHRTARCNSCKTIGQYVRETMEENYSQQIAEGVIDFRELNVESPENKEVALKFKASGSSLFINRIIGGQDNIGQDVNIWRLLGDEGKFKSYLEITINSSLGI